MDALLGDLRFALRSLRKRPGFTAAVLGTLALGIGANAAVFSVVDAALLRPLPYPEAEKLVVLHQDHRGGGGPAREAFSGPDFADVRRESTTLDTVVATLGWNPTVAGEGRPRNLRGLSVSPGYFELLGAIPRLGRSFRHGEEEDGGARVVILSHGLWERRFGEDPGAVGRRVTLDGERYLVAGIAPEGFRPPGGSVDVWKPLQAAPSGARMFRILEVVARLGEGATLARAGRELDAIAARLAERHPATNAGVRFEATPLREELVGGNRPLLGVLFGAVTLVLLAACVNVANLLLARGERRRGEVAIRTAVGASSSRLVRQLLTEHLVLAVAGGGLGLGVAWWGIDAFGALATRHLAVPAGIGVDGRVVAFALAATAVTGLAFGLLPAIHATRGERGLHPGGRKPGMGSGRVTDRGRGALVVTEIALSTLLLVGAGLLTRSFVRLARVDPGFDARGVLTAEVSLPSDRYGDEGEVAEFFGTLVERLEGRPGVRRAAAVSYLPMAGGDNDVALRKAPADRADDRELLAWYRSVTPQYFRTMGIPVVAGRGFRPSDGAGSRRVAVVNETLARRGWGKGEAVGRRMAPEWAPQEPLTIVGVVGDVRHRSLDREARPQIYMPFAQFHPERSMAVVARVDGDPADAAPILRSTVWSLDSDLAVSRVAPMDVLVGDSVATRRLVLLLFGAFAVIATVVAVIGVYAVTSYSVSRRTREIGVRLALGAGRGEILASVVVRTMTLAAYGIAGGLIAAFFLANFLRTLLYELAPTDPLTYLAISLLMAGTVLVATLVPGLRATRVDPHVALQTQ